MDPTKVESELVYYNEDETFRLKYRTDGKPLFQFPFEAEQVKKDDACYIDKSDLWKDRDDRENYALLPSDQRFSVPVEIQGDITVTGEKKMALPGNREQAGIIPGHD